MQAETYDAVDCPCDAASEPEPCGVAHIPGRMRDAKPKSKRKDRRVWGEWGGCIRFLCLRSPEGLKGPDGPILATFCGEFIVGRADLTAKMAEKVD